MCQTGNLIVKLQTSFPLRLSYFQLSFLIFADILDPDALTEVGKYAILGRVDSPLQLGDLRTQAVVCCRSLLLSEHMYRKGRICYLLQFRTVVLDLFVQMLQLVLDTGQAEFACILNLE